MKKTLFTKFIFLVAVIFSAAVNTMAQTDDATQKLAARLVKSASLKPGDVGVIKSGTHFSPNSKAP